MSKTVNKSIVPIERIASTIYLIRGEKVILDQDLAELYGVSTKVLNQAVTRNNDRFPDDFMFLITKDEFENLKSQIVTSSWGGRRYSPRAFTEQGVAMLSSVLRSKQAVQVNIAIIRTFVRMREILATHKDLAQKVQKHDRQISNLYEHVERLLAPPSGKKNPMGYIWHNDED